MSDIFVRLAAVKLANNFINKLESRLKEYEDTPEKFRPRLLNKTVQRGGHRVGDRYRGKTPITNLDGGKKTFKHVFDEHDQATRTSGTDDFSVFGEYPYR
jgi:hypothetical protein